MYPESDEQRIAREARLKELCESIGLEVTGSMVSLPGFPDIPALDASAIDLTRGPQVLLALAWKLGRAAGMVAAVSRAA